MADLLAMSLWRRERFSWGSAGLQDAGEVRDRYITALQAADNHDISPLLSIHPLMTIAAPMFAIIH